MNKPYLLYHSPSVATIHTYILAKDFIFDMPGCAEWSSWSTICWPGGGTNTRHPQRTHPSNWQFSFAWKVSVIDESHLLGQPCCINWSTWKRTGLLVHLLMSTTVTGDSAKCSNSRTSSGDICLSLSMVIYSTHQHYHVLACRRIPLYAHKLITTMTIDGFWLKPEVK